ncbi:MAG: ATP-binding protein [Gammaproteobacteria bacterium]|nr:ATP-binding protein [Gammaproteobacteria bacterium]
MADPRRILLALDVDADLSLAALVLRQAFPDDCVEAIGDPIAFAEALAGPAPAALVTALHFGWAEGAKVLAAVRRRYPDVVTVAFDVPPPEDQAARLPEIGVDRYVRRDSAGFLELPGALREAWARAAARRGGDEADRVFRRLVEDAPIGLFSATPSGLLTRANPALARVLGLPREVDPVGRAVGEVLGRALPDLASSLSEDPQRGLHEPEVRLVLGDGQVRWVGVDLWAVHDADGTLLRLDGAVQDVTSARGEAGRATGEAEAGRDSSRAELEQLAHAVSHDLQEPLHVLARHAHILSERYAKRLDAEGERFLGNLVGSAERMQAMLDGILEYARAGREDRALAPVDFNRALEEALENLRPRIEEVGADVRHTALPVLPAEYRPIVRLFQNLVGNALKFRGADPPRVVIGARERESDWRFAVKDNGIGIDPRFHQRIFGMFQRLHTAEEFPGTGVGLALCKRIVERHGGELWVHSAPGEGATFFFTLPKQPSPASPEATDRP